MQDDEFAFDVEVAGGDAEALAVYSHRHRQSWVSRWTGGYAAVGGLIVFGLLPPWSRDGLFIFGGILIAALLIVGLVSRFTVRRSARRFYSEPQNAGSLGRKSFATGVAGLSAKDEEGTYFFAWGRFSAVGSTVEHLFLYVGGRAIIIPRQAFRSAEESELFEKFVCAQIRAAPAPHDAWSPTGGGETAAREVVQFSFTRSDLSALIGPAAMSTRSKALFSGLPCAVSAPFIVPKMADHHWLISAVAAAMTFAIGAAVGLVYGKLIYWEYRRRYASQFTDQLGPVSVELSEREVTIVQPGEASRRAWHGIRALTLEGGYLRLMFSQVSGLMVPERAFPNAEAFDAFAERALAYHRAATAAG